jgi:hypothetical protein
MLLVFALGITPKKTLHDLIATHKDSPFQSANSKSPQLDRAGFHCSYDSLVVESPFLDDFIPLELTHNISFRTENAERENNFISADYFYFPLRGPPSLINS